MTEVQSFTPKIGERFLLLVRGCYVCQTCCHTCVTHIYYVCHTCGATCVSHVWGHTYNTHVIHVCHTCETYMCGTCVPHIYYIYATYVSHM